MNLNCKHKVRLWTKETLSSLFYQLLLRLLFLISELFTFTLSCLFSLSSAVLSASCFLYESLIFCFLTCCSSFSRIPRCLTEVLFGFVHIIFNVSHLCRCSYKSVSLVNKPKCRHGIWPNKWPTYDAIFMNVSRGLWVGKKQNIMFF